MSEEEKKILELLRMANVTMGCILDDKQANIILNLIDKLQKVIDLIIDDFQMENYFVGMTNKEVREYYKKRKELEE